MNLEYKVGDEVILLEYDNSPKKGENFSGFVGKKYNIGRVCSDGSIALTDDNGACFWVKSSQIKKVVSEEVCGDLVSMSENYVTATRDTDLKNTTIKSDGGSSSYYFTKLPQHMIDKIVETGGIEIKDITRYVYDNDSDCKDITKALKRIQEWKKGGGKQGIDALYDANKIIFFAKELRESIKNDFGDKLNK